MANEHQAVETVLWR